MFVGTSEEINFNLSRKPEYVSTSIDGVGKALWTIGHPFVIVQSHLTLLHKFPFIKENNAASLQDFTLELSSAVGSLVAAGYEHEFNLLSRLATKLPPRLRESWGEVVYQLQTVIDLESWIDQRATTAILNASLGEARVERKETERKPFQDPRPVSFQARSYATLWVNPRLVFVTSHRNEQCPMFNKLSLSDRAGMVRDLRCCYRCLENGFISANYAKGRMVWRQRMHRDSSSETPRCSTSLPCEEAFTAGPKTTSPSSQSSASIHHLAPGTGSTATRRFVCRRPALD